MTPTFNPLTAAEHYMRLATDIEVYLVKYEDDGNVKHESVADDVLAEEFRQVARTMIEKAEDFARALGRVEARRRQSAAQWRAELAQDAHDERTQANPQAVPESALRGLGATPPGAPADPPGGTLRERVPGITIA